MQSWVVMGLLFGVSTGAGAADPPTRLDPVLRMAMTEDSATPSLAKRLGAKAVAGGTVLVDLFVKTTDVDEATKIIEQWDGAVRTVAGDILIARLPLVHVEALSQLDIVEYVEADKRVDAKLNQSLSVIKANQVHNGTGLSASYTGSGVIVGVVDSGIDCDHADFNNDGGSSRLLGYWDQTTGTSGVSEISNSTGTEYTGSKISNGNCTSSADGDSTGHGTHVAGIATSNNSTYRGVAFQSAVMAVKHNAQDASSAGTFATTVVDGVNYIFRKAQSQSPKMPAVVNLSLGTSLGAHDGTSLFETSLDNLLKDSSGNDKQGRAIVNAAGNENFSSADTEATTYGGIHAAVSVSNTSKAFDFAIRKTATVFTVFGGVQVDMWLTSSSSCTIQLDAYALNDKASSALKVNMSPVSKGGTTSADSNTDGKIKIALDFSDSSNANNSKQHAVAAITKVSGASVSATDYSFDLIFVGTCEGDAWLYPDLTAAIAFRKTTALPVTTNALGYTYVSGDSDRTMTIPSTAKKVIAVGSFLGAGTWTDLNGTSHDQTATTEGSGGTAGQISLFSSLGPTPDGRVKPDISAPGEPIISTLASTVSASTSNKGDATHHKLEGSSMAAPHVAGTVALMLQRNNCLTPTELKDALITTASSSGITGTLPNSTWGAGKLDAAAAVAKVSAVSCEPDNTSENVSTSGGGSCALRPYE